MESGESCCTIPAIQSFITFRLAGSLPRKLLDYWFLARAAFLAANPPPWDDITEACYHGPFSDKLDEHLDAAHGSCALRDPRLAQIVADRLHHFDGQRYDLGSDVILLNHVHALFTLRDGESLPNTLQGWKGVSSRLIHKIGLSDLNPFWQPDDFDRLIRSPEPFSTVNAYLAADPPPWDEITEACCHGQFSDKLDEHLDDITDATQRVPAASCLIHASYASAPIVPVLWKARSAG